MTESVGRPLADGELIGTGPDRSIGVRSTSVEPGESPREGARRELFEETGVEAELLPEPATATVRSYHSRWPVTLGLSYAAIVESGTPLRAESGQPAAWMPLNEDWDSCFPEDPSRVRAHARWLREASVRWRARPPGWPMRRLVEIVRPARLWTAP
ncbi:NUDIX hydrolase [Streptomyces sp. NPDC058368]|uniref:NUDIX hydrolase n=1 Tax=Streptomyces sp. NPDC058368 TaxID=3346461 RepID=UPI003664D2E0